MKLTWQKILDELKKRPRVKTYDLYEVAFYLALGGEIVYRAGPYKKVFFILDVPRWVLIYKKCCGLIHWRKYKKAREEVKKELKNGNPIYLEDIARVREFTKSEKEKYAKEDQNKII